MRNLFRMAALGLAVLVGSSFAVAQRWDHDRDDHRYDRDYRYDRGGYDSFRNGMRVAHEIGYQDGFQVAREDSWRGKPFNPYPRSRYQYADHGYRRQFGDIRAYRDRYADGYGDGYRAAFRGQRGFQGYFEWGR